MSRETTGSSCYDDDGDRRDAMATGDENFISFISDAQTAATREHQMSVWQGIKLYPKAIAWSMVISSAVIMEGFDNALIGSFYAFPAFQRKYGRLLPDGTYGIDAAWQAGLSGGMNAGQVLGLLLNGFVEERYGHKKTMLVALFAVVALVPMLFFAENIQTLVAGEILLGLPLGTFQTLTIAYASEVCPVILRPCLTIYVNLSWVIGQFLALCVLRTQIENTSEWSYRIPFSIQWVWPVLIIAAVAFAPESPWWYIRHDRPEAALDALNRLVGSDRSDFNASQAISLMIHTNELEKDISMGTTYLDCFKGVDRRRTGITCLVFTSQALCGIGLMAYSAYFYVQVGLPTSASFSLSLAQYAAGFLGTILSLLLTSYFGRRSLYVVGLLILAVILSTIGFVSLGEEQPSLSWAIGCIFLAFVFFYNSTAGAVGYVLVSELSATRLRSKTLVISRILFNVLGIVNSVIIPYMLNPNAWNWKAKAGFFWGGLCFLLALLSYLFLPETKGRTYSELDVLFEQGVSARRFKDTIVDPFQHRLGVNEAERSR
ncbi:putative MFS alpha-glucoside transporter [Daldinia loculata]|nr:putative MFS alpha-glucoside transporter [Daldinia loculata]